MQATRWQERLQKKREGKDTFFKDHPQSPIPPRDRPAFEGLRYYPLDRRFRFELDLHEHEEKEVVRVDTTHGGERDLLRWGEFRFEIEGESCTLQAYRTNPGTERLFIPFRDGTSGLETHTEGRYLDLEPQIHRIEKGRWVLDFNEAYNPWCEYSGDYICPYAPTENALKPAVRVGERSFRGPEIRNPPQAS